MVAMQDIRRYCDSIAVAIKPQQIILFGSYAYGRPDADSDVDVLVVMSKSKKMGRRVSLEIREKVGADFPVDIVVRDSGFLAERLEEGDTFLELIIEKGRVMYESCHPRLGQ